MKEGIVVRIKRTACTSINVGHWLYLTCHVGGDCHRAGEASLGYHLALHSNLQEDTLQELAIARTTHNESSPD